MKIDNQDKILVNQFLELPIDRDEFDKLYIILLEVVEKIRPLFSIIDKLEMLERKDDNGDNYKKIEIKLEDNKSICMEFSIANLEIIDDEDNIYKELEINPKDKTICISLCENLENKYFVSKNITYHNENNIEFTKILAKSEYPKTDAFKELALKKWQYNGKGVSLDCFTELANINYINDIPLYSIYEYKNKKNHYHRSLSKNK